ncbi:hypothetical protein EKN94_04180 [Enterobacter quasimori]|uniref:Eaa protein n=1 Tax=Enterobacter quasimori TaxID=2838947 RepID=A0ABY0AWY3_9ENTR|nr:hypothetical protein [Enterobacter quasimori]RTN26270.1 hypothetical protein EKN94_04180 [Enterobacter quasimori]
MSTITKEWLQQKIAEMEARRDDPWLGLSGDESNMLEALCIALASLEAEAVADVVAWSSPNEERTCDIRLRRHDITAGPLYTAPPVPVAVPDMAIPQSMRAMFCQLDDSECAIAADVWNACCAAMLHGADGNSQVMNDYPETLPCPVQLEPGLKLGKGVPTKILLEALQSRANYSAEIEVIKEVCGDIKNGDFLAAAKINGSSELVTTAYKLPVGWVAVPVEPTEDMIVNGFESEPDESFSDEKEWEAYDAMSGCQQAAHRAKLCWAAMIAAAPKLE